MSKNGDIIHIIHTVMMFCIETNIRKDRAKVFLYDIVSELGYDVNTYNFDDVIESYYGQS